MKIKLTFFLLILNLLSFCLAQEQLDAFQLNELAYAEVQKANPTELFRLANKALQKAKQENNKIEEARALSNIASAYYYLSSYEKALNLYLESYEIAKQINHSASIDRALSNISNVYSSLDKIDETLIYRLKSKALLEKAHSNADIISNKLSLALTYLELDNYDLSLKNINDANNLLSKKPNSFLKGFSLLYEALYYKKIKNNSKALEIFSQLKSLSLNNKYVTQLYSSLAYPAEIYLEQGKYKQAKKNILEALNYAKEFELNVRILTAYQLLAKIEKAQSNFKAALEHTEIAQSLKEQISTKKVNQLAEITKIERQVAETEEKLKQSENDKKIAELQLASQQQQQMIWGVVFIALFGYILFWLNQRNNRKEFARQKTMNEELVKLDKMKDRILTNTSHELRTPLNGIIGLSQVLLLQNEDKLDAESLKFLKLIEKSGNQLSDIVNDILDLAKYKNQQIQIRPREFDLNSLIKEVILTCKPLLADHTIAINFKESSNPLLVFHDKMRVKQILLNIIGNAAKFTKAGHIDIRVKEQNQQVTIDVIDTGIGIPEHMQGRVFEGFEQVDANDSREYTGSGLGLAICKEITQAIDGSISLTSQEGKGTQVTLVLAKQFAQ